MKHFTHPRTLLAIGVLVASSSPLLAQRAVGFGSVEAAGFGQNQQLAGVSLSRGGPGWSPVVTLMGLRLGYRAGSPTEDVQSWAFSPSAGLKYETRAGSLQGSVGYSWVNKEEPNRQFGDVASAESRPGLSTALQHNYWGDGSVSAQLIGSYNWGSEYLWTRARGARRLGAASPAFLGGELVFQGGGEGDKTWVVAAGPMLQFHFGPSFQLGFAAGYRQQTTGDRGTGYGKIDFVILPR